MIQIFNMDCLLAMSCFLEDNSVDAIVTDPPYGLTQARPGGRSPATEGAVMKGFMGLAWDSGVPSVDIWRECLRVLKPGGHLLCFAGTRTQHRMAVNIEDAGFEIRDMIAWVYGSGFPKSLDVSKAIDKAAGAEREFTSVGNAVARMIPGADQAATGSWIKDNGRDYQPGVSKPATDAARQWQGWGTALKPALEPITVARKPLVGTVAANVLEHGTGALNIDGCRVAMSQEDREFILKTARPNSAGKVHIGDVMNRPAAPTVNVHDAGRWPANLIHDGSDEVLHVFPQAQGQQGKTGKRTQGVTYNAVNEGEAGIEPRGDAGSAARFFYCPKASKSDRGAENTHPTVKPTNLMRYLCRLVTPPGGVVLDPFMGSGSTGKAALLEGFKFIGCELSEDYVAIARARLDL